jgi:lipoteichoic acid synthase
MDGRSLPSPLSAWLAALALLGLPLSLKVHKVVGISQGRWSVADLLIVAASDVAVACVALTLSLLLARLCRGRRAATIAYFAASTLALSLVLGLTALEHEAWVRSSTLLDWTMLWYSIEHYRELRPIVASETTTQGLLLLGTAFALALLPLLAELVVGWLRGAPDHGRRALRLAPFFALPPLVLATLSPSQAELHPLRHPAALGILLGALERAPAGARRKPLAEGDVVRVKARVKSALGAAGITAPAAAKPKSVLLLVLESTRWDATSVHVPELATTPRLAELAKAGMTVERTLVDMPHTSKALISILCGYSPRWSVEITEAEAGGLSRPCLPHVLGELGYDRAFFQAATGRYENRHQLALNAGFDEVRTRESYDETGFEETNYLSVEDKVMLKPIDAWLGQRGDKPFLLTVLTCITHHAYGLPSDYVLREHEKNPARVGGRMPRPFSDYNRYLNAVTYADELLGELIEALRRRGQLDDTLIVVVGDHGQGFYEHGQKGHNTVIWDEGLRVPLVFHNPTLLPEPTVIEGLRRQVDIAPTVLSLLGVAHSPSLFEGRELRGTAGYERVHSTCWYDRRCAAETTLERRIVENYDHRPMEVYDLVADPFERRNLLTIGRPEDRAAAAAEAEAARARIAAHKSAVESAYGAETAAARAHLLTAEPAPGHPLRARLGDALELIGYDAATHEVVPDGFWDVVVYFRCVRPSELGWRLFTLLETEDGRKVQTDHHPGSNRLYLHQCKAGQVVADHVRIWIPGDFPGGALRVFWGSVQLKELGHVTQENKRLARRPIVPLQRGLLVRDKALLLAELKVKPQYRPELAKLLSASVLRSDPKRGTKVGARFGEHLTLVSAEVTPARVRRLSSVSVTTVWRVDGEQLGPAQIAIEIASRIPGYGMRVLHAPLDGIHPIRNWQPGTYVVDTHAVPMPELMPTGDATIYVGIGIKEERLPGVDARGIALPVGGVQIGKISVAK